MGVVGQEHRAVISWSVLVSPYGEAKMHIPGGEAKNQTRLRDNVNQLMELAIAHGDYKEVQRLARIAEELSALEQREVEIAQSRANLAAMLEKPVQSQIDQEEVSARERGNRVRAKYVELDLVLREIHLQRISTKKYRTANGLLVGIAYAKELEIRPSFWFLGLSDEHFDCVILLCESSERSGGEIAALVLPSEFVKRIWKDLSRSKGQVKFHVARTGYFSFELGLPGLQRINISQYLNAVEVLKVKGELSDGAQPKT
jgi:hypothetical protein